MTLTYAPAPFVIAPLAPLASVQTVSSGPGLGAPISSDWSAKKRDTEAKVRTERRSAIERARHSVEAGWSRPGVLTKAERLAAAASKGTRDTGTANVIELIEPAPERLAISREAWAATPLVIRDEIWRMVREITAGIEKYRSAAERNAELAEFHEMAERQGTTVPEALSKFIAMENMIRAKPVEGIKQVLTNVGIDPIEWARTILESDPEAA